MFTAILCPVDFSPHSERALAYAIGMAKLSGAHLTIVTVVDALLDAASHATGSGGALAMQTQQEIQALLSRVSDEQGAPVERPAIAVVVGEPAEEILKQAIDCGADLIVMGTQGLSAARRFVFGSTTDKVLRESHVPVLAVPSPLD